MSISTSARSSILLLSDSHGRNLNTIITTTHYDVKVYAISGLQWVNKYDKSLSLFSIVQQETFSSLIGSTSYVLFLLGTNSLRNLSAIEVISQVDHLLAFLYSRYIHLRNNKIIITSCIPCLKTSKRFSSTLLLKNNIDHYNTLLLSLSTKYNFSYFDLQIPVDWLGPDMMHIGYHYRSHFSNIILHHIGGLHVERHLDTQVKRRSMQSIAYRNRKRNMKLKQIQKNFTLLREISREWSYPLLKTFLKSKDVQYARLYIAPNNVLHIYFHNTYHLQNAEETIPLQAFTYNRFI